MKDENNCQSCKQEGQKLICTAGSECVAMSNAEYESWLQVSAGAADSHAASPMAALRRLIADDAYAMTFQTFGQYRTALLKSIDAALSGAAPTPQPELTDERMPSPEVRPLSLEESLSGAQVCCTDYASCHRACTPRGRWQASQAIQEIEREFVAVDDLPAFIRRLQDEVREVRSLLGAAPTQPGLTPVGSQPK